MKKSYNRKMIYAVKHLMNESGEKIIGFTCPDEIMLQTKNEDVATTCTILSKNGSRILLINFDPEFSAEFEFINVPVTEDACRYDFATALKDVDMEQYDKILINLCPIQHREYLLERSLSVKEVVLCIKYGVTAYTHFEKAMDLLRQNDMKLIGTLAHQ